MASGSDVRAGGAFVEFFSKGDKAVQATLKDLEARMKNMGKSVVMAGAMLASLGASVTGPMLAGLAVASEWTSGLISAAQRTGLGFQDLQTLAFGLRIDLEEMAGATRHMNSFLNEAAHGSAQANLQLEELRLTIDELMQLSEAGRIRRLADALSRVGDAGHRGALQTGVFGRGGMAMNVSGGAAGVADREQRARRFVMSDADIALMREYNAAQKELGLATKALWASIGAAAAGPMTEFFRLVTDVLLRVKDWTQANRPLMTTIFKIADGLVTAGAALAFMGGAIMAASYAFRLMYVVFSTGFAILKFATLLLTGGMGLLTTATLIYQGVALGAALVTKLLALSFGLATAAAAALSSVGLLPLIIGLGLIVGAVALAIVFLPKLWELWLSGMSIILDSLSGVGAAIGNFFTTLVADLTRLFVNLGQNLAGTFGALMDALAANDLEMAWEIIVLGLTATWLRFVADFKETWFNVVENVQDIWDAAVTWMAHTIVSISSGIYTLMLDAFYKIRGGWSQLVEWMAVALSGSMTEMEVMWIRGREALNPVGSAERTNRLIAQARAEGVDRENLITRDGAREREQIEAEGAARILETERRTQDLHAAIDRLRRVAANPDDDPEVIAAREAAAAAEQELEIMMHQASLARWLAEENRRRNLNDAREGMDTIATTAHNSGTFSAQAASGFAGGTAMDRLQRTTEDSRDRLDRILAAILANGGVMPQMG